MTARDRLVEATQQLLWERGYAATSPKDIQAAARAGQGSMYHHFASKEALAIEALTQSATAMRHDAAALLDGRGTALERLEAYLLRERDSLRGCPVGRMTFDPDVVATPTLLAPVAETLEWLTEAITSVAREGVASGDIRPDTDTGQFAAAIVAVVQGGYVLARAKQDPGPFESAIGGALTLLRNVAA